MSIDTLRSKLKTFEILQVSGAAVQLSDIIDELVNYIENNSGSVTNSEFITAAASQTTFTFTAIPVSYNDYIIFRNGIAIESTLHYTTAGNVVTMPTAFTGDRIRYQRIK